MDYSYDAYQIFLPENLTKRGEGGQPLFVRQVPDEESKLGFNQAYIGKTLWPQKKMVDRINLQDSEHNHTSLQP